MWDGAFLMLMDVDTCFVMELHISWHSSCILSRPKSKEAGDSMGGQGLEDAWPEGLCHCELSGGVTRDK